MLNKRHAESVQLQKRDVDADPWSANIAAGLLSRNYERPHGNAAATKKGIWQPNYYEHIIRNEKALYKIRKYIQENPDVEKLNFKQFYGKE